jgi:FtsP/CotA-like multicopper oxidase with cupredoxin domain
MVRLTRRQLLVNGAAGGAGLLLIGRLDVKTALALGGAAATTTTLDPHSIEKYRQAMIVPPAMPRTRRIIRLGQKPIDVYEIAVRQFQQQILPPGMPQTTVWSYGSVNHPGTFNYPAFTLEAKWQTPVRVTWINDLVDGSGNYLPHLLSVDPTLHWANPPGGEDGRDMRPTFDETPGPYTGPVPIVPHLHGGEMTPEWADGYAEAWYLPDASNIPAGYATNGRFYGYFRDRSPIGDQWASGRAVFEYPNDQRATTLWYHDHTLGMTRLNVYAGPAGFYLLRGGPSDDVDGLPGPAPALGDSSGIRYYEIPIAIQDRTFGEDGSLWYPDSRELFDGYPGPYIPEGEVSPIWNPEFFGDTIVVNGRTWPYLEVERRRYRFRFLNGCNSRFLILKLDDDLPFWQIGTEGGFLPAPVQLERLLMGPAERADVIVDFSDAPAGTEIVLRNLGPDEPFGGGEPDEDFDAANSDTTGQIMQFRVVRRHGPDRSTPPQELVLPAFTPIGDVSNTRQVSLNESPVEIGDGEEIPVAALLGTLNPDGSPNPLEWMDPITEHPALDSTEIWELYNFTVDAHPIHIHEVQFQVVDRQPFEGASRPPESWETGFKDTVIAYPGEITRVKTTFKVPGRFVWHCHIVEHEDNEMMRPYEIG